MTRLLIDIGNSRIKWARDETPLSVDSAAHDGAPETVLGTLVDAKGAHITLAHVFGGGRDAALEDALRAAGAVVVRIVRPVAAHGGLRLAYAMPERLGADRFLTMQALWQELHSGFVVASAGTALTVDVVDSDGQHLGGYIAPGLTLMRQAVLQGTRFDHGDDAPPQGQPGTSTEGCVAEAALLACTGMLDASLRRHTLPGFLCGGDAPTLLPHLGGGWVQRDHLVLEGLRHWMTDAQQ